MSKTSSWAYSMGKQTKPSMELGLESERFEHCTSIFSKQMHFEAPRHLLSSNKIYPPVWMEQVVVVCDDDVVINVLYYIYLSILSWMILFLVDYFSLFLSVESMSEAAHPFQCTLPKIVYTYFQMASFFVRTFSQREKLVSSFEININTLGNKTMYIIACCLQRFIRSS